MKILFMPILILVTAMLVFILSAYLYRMKTQQKDENATVIENNSHEFSMITNLYYFPFTKKAIVELFTGQTVTGYIIFIDQSISEIVCENGLRIRTDAIPSKFIESIKIAEEEIKNEKVEERKEF